MADLFDISIAELERWSTGEQLRHGKLNQAVDTVNRLFDGVQSPLQITYTQNEEEVAAALTQRFKLIALKKPDHLEAKTWDGTTLGESTINIACPWELRRTPFDTLSWHAITYTYQTDERRLADNGTSTEYQVIVPQYAVNDEIWAVNVLAADGGTGLTDITWMEVFSSRMWVRDNDQSA